MSTSLSIFMDKITEEVRVSLSKEDKEWLEVKKQEFKVKTYSQVIQIMIRMHRK